MNFIHKWKDKLAHYVDVRLQLMKLGIIERASGVLSYLIFVFICLFLSVSVLIFLGIAMGEGFSQMLDSRPLGYLMTTGAYVVLIFIMFLLRNVIIKAFAGVFVSILTSVDDGDDYDEAEKTAEK